MGQTLKRMEPVRLIRIPISIRVRMSEHIDDSQKFYNFLYLPVREEVSSEKPCD